MDISALTLLRVLFLIYCTSNAFMTYVNLNSTMYF